MIAYEAAPGEKVVVAATELFTPVARPSAGWRIPEASAGATVRPLYLTPLAQAS